jgi:hypothetical protein
MPRQAGSCRSCRTLGLAMLRIEPLRSPQCVVGRSARELVVRQPAALTERCAVPYACALSGSRLAPWSGRQSQSLRFGGHKRRSRLAAWRFIAGPAASGSAGPRVGAGTGFARAGGISALVLQTVPHIGAQASTAEASSTLWPNPSFERTATGGRHWRAAGVHLRRCLPLNSNVRPPNAAH